MYDNKLILKDSGEVTATGFATVDNEAQIIDLGTGLVEGNLEILVDAIKISADDEAYTIVLFGGDDASFTNEVQLLSLELGANEILNGNVDSETGKFILPLTNKQNGTVYPYVRLKHVISGTSPAITYQAYLKN